MVRANRKARMTERALLSSRVQRGDSNPTQSHEQALEEEHWKFLRRFFPITGKRILRGWRRILAWNLFCIVLVFYIAEILLRTVGPFRGLPVNGYVGGKHYTWGHEYATNPLGFRGPEIAVAKPANVFRIVVVGDSLTWGSGLAENERYTERLEARLRKETGRAVEVVNRGRVGIPTTTERDILSTNMDLWNPDLVIVGFCLNDLQPRDQDYCPERARFRKRMAIPFKICHAIRRIGLRYVGEIIRDGILGAAERLHWIPSWPDALDRAYADGAQEWKDFNLALADIAKMCRARGLPAPIFAVLNQGASFNKPTDYGHPDAMLKRFLFWYHKAEGAARSAGFRTVNFEDELASQLTSAPMGINARDLHPTAAVNKVYAEKLAGIVREVLEEQSTSSKGGSDRVDPRESPLAPLEVIRCHQ
ncbi:MAG TPA: SGNH/GDSL hydrolase family protein [Verrucomicrobiae bacterium]|nr:SGNH/GDSL hydrolase family protein [Verrucomicrobiae bacterium]